MLNNRKITIGTSVLLLVIGLITLLILFLIPSNKPVDQQSYNRISMGSAHSSLLTKEGKLYMWGDNSYGQLGNGESEEGKIEKLPINITDQFENDEEELIDLTNSQISIGELHSSLLTQDGKLFMWGLNDYGQLGNGTENDKNTPTEITDQFLNEENEQIDLTNSKISLGSNHSTLLTEDGRMFTWGRNNQGQLGNGKSGGVENKPIEITNKFVINEETINLTDSQISMGEFHSSLLTQDGKLFMWGDNEFGQLGNGTENDKNTPTEITDQFLNEENEQVDLTNSKISLGNKNSSVLTEDGRMFMWGYNADGQLGDETRDNKNTPTNITDKFLNEENEQVDLTNSILSIGEFHSSLLTIDGKMFTWGKNADGQLGNNKGGFGQLEITPYQITNQFFDEDEDENVEMIDLTNAQIAMGDKHSSLLTEDGRMFTWGYNYYGQIGNGQEKINKNKPTEITDKFVEE